MKNYVAYGSNMNIGQMKKRCPTATIVGTGQVEGYELLFRGGGISSVATIEPKKDRTVPVVIWKIKPSDEAALDRYEGFPYLYRKERITVLVGKDFITAMVYIMNDNRPIGLPSEGYFQTILEGYLANNLDAEFLFEACYKCKEQME